MDYFPLDLAPPKAESLGKIVSAGGVRVSALVRSMIIVGDSPKSSPNFLTQSSPTYTQSIPQSNPTFPGTFSPIQVHNQVHKVTVALNRI